MKPEYNHAVESRLQWLRWAKGPTAFDVWMHLGSLPAMRAAISILEAGAGFFMDAHFQELVAVARLEIPDTLVFETTWLLAPSGFMWLDVPFLMPAPGSAGDGAEDVAARAVGWRPVLVPDLTEERTQFLVFVELPNGGFGCWSYMVLHPGKSLGDRITELERDARDAPDSYRDVDLCRHELRWIYAAFHLMAQKLTVVVPEPTDRAIRHRARRDGQEAPPLINVVTLRRLHLAQHDGEAHSDVNWQWRWTVTGHWRNQWFPSAATHKPVFIEAFMKGPADKPLKPTAIRLYVARR